MRVLHLVKTAIHGRFALVQMKELVGHGVEVHVAMPTEGPMVEKYRNAGITVHPLQAQLPVRRPYEWPRLRRALRDLVGRVAPDLIHSHFVATTLSMRLALGRLHPIPRVFQVAGPLHLEHAFFRQLDVRTAGPWDHWVATCRWTYDCYGRLGVPEHRRFLSYYGLPLDQFSSRPRGKLRKELQVDEGTRLVGMVAYMYAPKRYLGQKQGIKGHEDLIDAVAIALRDDPNLLVVFIGGAWNGAFWYERKIQDYACARLGDRARFLGMRNDVPELYPDFDVAVHPSHSENLGGAAESLVMGVPTIASNLGGFPDLVIPGETGWLVPPHQPAQLARAILDALHDAPSAQAMTLRGQQRARSLLDVRSTGEEVFRIYREILRSRRGPASEDISSPPSRCTGSPRGYSGA